MKYEFEVIIKNINLSRDELHERFFQARIFDATVILMQNDAHFTFNVEAESLSVAMFKAAFDISRLFTDEQE